MQTKKDKNGFQRLQRIEKIKYLNKEKMDPILKNKIEENIKKIYSDKGVQEEMLILVESYFESEMDKEELTETVESITRVSMVNNYEY